MSRTRHHVAVLEILGIPARSEAAYRTLLSGPRSVADLARDTGRSERTVRKDVAVLEQAGLVSRLPGRPVRLLAASPDLAIDALVARRQHQLVALQTQARTLVPDVGAAQPDELLEVLVGSDAVADRFTRLVRGARHELLVIDRPPYAASAPESETEVTTRLSDDLRVVGLYAPESLDQPGALAAAQRAVASGEQSRMHPKLPMKLAIADRREALLPLVLEDMVHSALVVRRCALLDALIVLFELLWDQAAPLTALGSGGLDAELLTLLAAGAKDETIARQLGVSPRTVTRRVAELLNQLGARTRFHAGVLSEREGRIDS